MVAELYIDGLSTALRHNKPEISPPSVEWNLSEVSDDFHRREFEESMKRVEEFREAEAEDRKQLESGDD